MHRIAAALAPANAAPAYVARLKFRDSGHWVEVSQSDGQVVYVAGPFASSGGAISQGIEFIEGAERCRAAARMRDGERLRAVRA